MSTFFNRRDWLKSATLAAGATCLGSRAFANGETGTRPSARSSHGFLNLSINENQFGPSPAARQAIAEAGRYAHEYPMPAQDRLRQAIARREKVDTSQIILGAGSSDILMGMANCFGRKGGNIVSSDPTFAPLMAWAAKFGIESRKLPWTSEYGVDLERIKASITDDTSLVYLCNPENPAGTLLPPDQLYAFCQDVAPNVPVLIDEAYLEFAGETAELSMARCVREGLPVIVLRTFSKAYALGGMRVGYAIASEQQAAEIDDYYVTGIGCGCSHSSLEAALAAYRDVDWLRSVRTRTAAARDRMTEFLQNKGYQPVPSHATFLLCPVQADATQLADAIFGAFNLRISPRFYFNQNFLRLSMGTPEQMDQLATALDYVL